jgi:hypothetical protein
MLALALVGSGATMGVAVIHLVALGTTLAWVGAGFLVLAGAGAGDSAPITVMSEQLNMVTSTVIESRILAKALDGGVITILLSDWSMGDRARCCDSSNANKAHKYSSTLIKTNYLTFLLIYHE